MAFLGGRTHCRDRLSMCFSLSHIPFGHSHICLVEGVAVRKVTMLKRHLEIEGGGDVVSDGSPDAVAEIAHVVERIGYEIVVNE